MQWFHLKVGWGGEREREARKKCKEGKGCVLVSVLVFSFFATFMQ